ncbi:TldD/PmbA family protein [Candidatus Methanoprimaticola sp. MG2]|uniref:TldD/PmbA family protein n=1 Tax=Candidatus Methanoprimaticola sp. MG2 TaxID=3228838 RepID=UPI0039C71E9A
MESVSIKAQEAQDVLHLAVERMRDLGADFADARSQTVRVTGASTINGDLKQLVQKSTGGVCLRAWSGGRWGYGTSTSFDREAVLRAAEEAAANAKGDGIPGLELEPAVVRGDHRAKVRIHPDSVDLTEKIQAALDIDRAQAIDDRIINRAGAYSEEIKTNALVNSAGSDLSWEEVRTLCRAMSIAADGQRMEQYYDGPDSTKGFEVVRDADLEGIGRGAAREAIVTLGADRAPSGNMTVISDPMVSGLLAHEAMGHASEGDEITKRRSFLTDAVGRKVASDLITMYDDGTVAGAHGSIPFDDEGTPSSRVTIIDHGEYKGYMHSLETASRLGVHPTGNGRAENSGKRVWVRMTNTFFGPGDWDKDELIADTKEGILCDKMLNGMEDPVGGCFEAKCLRGYLIRNGEIVKPVQSFTLTGKSIDILSSADALTNEVLLDGGMCGKGIEDWVRVSTGGPYMRARMIVGGGQ